MKKTTKKMLKAAEYGVTGFIWSYDYAQFTKYREEATKRVITLDKDDSKKKKLTTYAKFCGACFAEAASFTIASSMFTKALLTGVELVNELKK